MLAYGNDEINKLPKIGKKAICPNCNKKHLVNYGEQVMPDGTKIPSKMLGYVNCGKNIYLVAINEKELEAN